MLWQQILSVVFPEVIAHFINFEKISVKNTSNNYSLSAGCPLKYKRYSMKSVKLQFTTQFLKCFSLKTAIVLGYAARSALCIVPILLLECLRCVLRDRDLIKFIMFITSSKIFFFTNILFCLFICN